MRTSRNGWMMRWRLKRLLRACRKLPLELERLIEEPWRPRRSRRALRESLHAIEDSWPGPYERQLWCRELCEIPCPVLVLWGGRDRLNPSRRATELLQLLPEAYLFEDEASGHWPMLENPDWVIEKVREFIFQLAEAAPELSRARRSLSR